MKSPEPVEPAAFVNPWQEVEALLTDASAQLASVRLPLVLAENEALKQRVATLERRNRQRSV